MSRDNTLLSRMSVTVCSVLPEIEDGADVVEGDDVLMLLSEDGAVCGVTPTDVKRRSSSGIERDALHMGPSPLFSWASLSLKNESALKGFGKN